MVTETFMMSAFGLSRLQEADHLQHRSILYFTIECMFSVTVYLMFSINHVKLRKPAVHAQESCQDLLGHEIIMFILSLLQQAPGQFRLRHMYSRSVRTTEKSAQLPELYACAFIPTMTTRTRSPLCLTSDAVATSWKPACGTTE
ncbi:hypothetical protein ARMSODRAFT_758526 [Armillaria solidipes]|uniref:Uncharacterized protein n=1 Tax=Armillaria solidipes TaxID=1076256 RepID=A0A2H3C8H9_9AGAR|nr:hypothetical protein ARMSODRAFT_758526 [Armillaria solidipes]